MANENQAWYEEIIRKAAKRNSGLDEIEETNPLDWERLRILENGKFVPAMAKGHSGTPSTLDISILRDAAKSGTLFLFRLGEEYPMQLADGVWYSTDPAAAEEKQPEVTQDNTAQIAAWEKRTRFFGELGSDVKRAIRDEMPARREEIQKRQEKQRAFVLDSQPLVNWYNNEFSRSTFQPGRGPEAVGSALDWSQYRIWDGRRFVNAVPEGLKGSPDVPDMERLREAAQKGNLFFYRNGDEYPQRFDNGVWYDTSPAAKQEAKPAVKDENAPEVQAWQKRVGYYDGLSDEQKRGIQNGVAYRREEIRNYQEKQRAAAESQPLGRWYNNEFRRNMMQPSSDPDLLASDGMDWSRVRIWDGKQFVRPVPEGHIGVPSNEALKKLQDASRKGNLFMYQRGDKYPSKWVGDQWSSMDKGWLDRSKPVEPKPLPNKPVKPDLKEPSLNDATKGVSNARIGVNKAFSRIGIKVFQREVEKRDEAVENYEEEKERYDQAMEEYNQALEAYNKETKIRQDAYHAQMKTHGQMVRDYERLTPEQRNAMEQDVKQRTEEIKRNKEVEKKIADEKLGRERATKIRIADAEARIAIMENQPEQEAFLQGNNPLGQNAYNTIAPHSYALPVDSRITPNEVAAIHIVLAGSKQAASAGGLSPMNAQEYGQMLDGVLHGDPNKENWQYITASYDAAQKMIAAFEKGDPKQLAEALGEGVRNLVNASKRHLDMSPEMAGMAKLTEKIFEVLDTHKDLMDNCTLTPDEINFARGMVNLGKIYSNYIDARMELTMMSTGAQKLSPEKMNEHTANLLIGKMTENRLQQEQRGLEKPKILEALGKGNGQAINIVQFAYRNNPDIQKFAADPQTQKELDLDKRAKGLAHIFGTTVLAKPKESPEIQNQVTDQIKKQMENSSPEALKAKRLAEQKDLMERQQVRELLAKEDDYYRTVSLKSPIVTEKLRELREAKERLDLRETQLIPPAPPKPEEKPKTQEELAQDKRAKGLAHIFGTPVLTKPDEKKEVKQVKEEEVKVEVKTYDLFSEEVQAEAMDRALVRDLLRQEQEAMRAQKKRGPEVNAFTVSRRLDELRKAQQQLSSEGKDFELTSKEVIEKAAENRKLRAERMKEPVKELLVAKKVYLEEYGQEPVGKNGVPSYRSKEVMDRLKQLIEARKQLGEEGANLQLDDMKVIQKDYEIRKVDSLKAGIVDVSRLTPEQRTEYEERMAAADFLWSVRGVKDLYPNASRYHTRVENVRGNLIQARANYEKFVEGAEMGLPLSDPKIIAMHMYKVSSLDSQFVQKVTMNDVKELAQKIQGKNFDQAQVEAKQQIRNIQIRDNHPRIEGQPYQRQEPKPVQAPALK